MNEELTLVPGTTRTLIPTHGLRLYVAEHGATARLQQRFLDGGQEVWKDVPKVFGSPPFDELKQASIRETTAMAANAFDNKMRQLAAHYMKALEDVILAKSIEQASGIAGKALGSNPAPSSHVAPSDTVTVAEHMKDFEAFVAMTAPKLHWKVYQDLGADPALSKGYYDGWQHGFGEEVLGPLPIPQLMEVMKQAVRRRVAALATTGDSEG
jgi:hypothetical protein